ncbi:MAG: hypothetical protein PHV05_11510 [Candidatus Riflebacteria bacterium]|nr:hypothetical protein [Candidatus Riflebacteria bacterium]
MKKHIAMLFLSLALIAVSIVLYSAEISDQNAVFQGRHHETGCRHPDMIELFGMFKLADDLEITNPQLLQLRMLFQKSSVTLKKDKKTGPVFKRLVDQNLTEEEIKKIAVEEGKTAEARVLAGFQLMQELKKILTPEQLKKLHERRPPMGIRRSGFLPPPEVFEGDCGDLGK